MIAGSDGGRALAGTAAALTLVFVATIRLTAVGSRREAGGLVVGTLLGVLVASTAAISTTAVVALAAVAVGCALPGAGTEVSARLPGARSETAE